MRTETDRRGETAEEKVRDWLRIQGYPLEYETARVLRAVGFRTIQGWSYRAEDEAGMVKAREIDVLASLDGSVPGDAEHKSERARFTVAVECKHMTAPWVVLTTEHPPEWTPVMSQWMESLLRDANVSAVEAFPLPPAVGFSVKTTAGKDVAHESLMQATNAASAAAFRGPYGAPPPEWAMPLLVVRGDLFTLGYDARGREALAEVPWCRLVWHGADAISFPTVVDVDTRAHLRVYARQRRKTAGTVIARNDARRAAEQAAEHRRVAKMRRNVKP